MIISWGECIKHEEHGYCSSDFRTDKENVIFKELREEILDIKHEVQEIGLDKEEEQAFMRITDLLYLKK